MTNGLGKIIYLLVLKYYLKKRKMENMYVLSVYESQM
jgi:hypothetical protein